MHSVIHFLLEGILGYGLQSLACLIGIHGIAQHKIDIKKSLLVCIACALITFFVRSSGLFNFGVHTMLVLLIINAMCITICRISIRPCILGSIVMMILVLLSELVNVGILFLVVGGDQISTALANETFKAASAVPGNIVLLLAGLLIYRFRTRGGKKNGSGQSVG